MEEGNEKIGIDDEVVIISTNEKGKVVYIDKNKKSYLISKNDNNSDVQFYNITCIKKIKK